MLSFLVNFIFLIFFGVPGANYLRQNYNIIEQPKELLRIPQDIATKVNPNSTPESSNIPHQKTLANDYHIFQTFNNCGPAALSMTLSYFGIHESQKTLGDALRPYQIASGDNDDKSTSLEELASKAQDYGLLAYHRPAGDIELLKKFIANDIPVITRTWTKPNEDIGHFRVVKGYNDSTSQLVQDDSLQGKNLRYSYSDFNVLWEKFNFEYLVLVPKDKEEIANKIIGENLNEKVAWQKAVNMSQSELSKNPNNVTARFNLSVALFNIGDYQGSVREFEEVENQLPFRTLWYQTEPIEAYFNLGNYERVFEITDQILNNGNRAYSELYIIRGDVYKAQGNLEAAKAEYEKAIFYNKNLIKAQDKLTSLE